MSYLSKVSTGKILFFILIVYTVITGLSPLLYDFSFDFAEVVTLPVALVSAVQAVNIYFPGRKKQKYHSSRKKIGKVLKTAFLFSLAPLSVALIRIVFHRPCSFFDGFAYYLLLPFIGSFFGASIGILAASATSNVKKAYWVLFTMSVSIIVYSLVRIALTPAVYSFNPLFGYFPGPIYDYGVHLSRSLVIARLILLPSIYIIIFLSIFLSDRKNEYIDSQEPFSRKTSRNNPGTASVIAFTVSVIIVVFVFLESNELGLSTSRRYHRSIMSGIIETPHFETRFEPDSMDTQDLLWFTMEEEFRFFQLSGFFNETPGKRFVSYLYPSPERKKQLMGAGRTQIIDPLERAAHLNMAPFPHPMLKHETAHLFTLDFGLPLIHLSVSPGLIEGIAVAAEYSGDTTIKPHKLAASLVRENRPLSAKDFIDPVRFWAGSGTRSYNLAGSFIRFLVDKYGMESFKKVYPTGAFRKVYGKSLSELSEEWLMFLQSVKLDTTEVTRFVKKMSQSSIFSNRCARFEADRITEAAVLYEKAEYEAASEVCRKILDKDPSYMQAIIMLAEIKDAAGNTREAEKILKMNEDHFLENFSGRLFYLRKMGEISWKLNKLREARRFFTELSLVNRAPRSAARGRVRLACLELPDADRMTALQVISGESTSGDTAGIPIWSKSEEAKWVEYYLSGRVFMLRHEYHRAASSLESALNLIEGTPDVEMEIDFYFAESLFFSGEFKKAEREFRLLADSDVNNIYDCSDWLERSRWYSKNVSVERVGDGYRPVLKSMLKKICR